MNQEVSDVEESPGAPGSRLCVRVPCPYDTPCPASPLTRPLNLCPVPVVATCLVDGKIVWHNEATVGHGGQDLLERELAELLDDSCKPTLDAVFAQAAAHKDGVQVLVHGRPHDSVVRKWELTLLLPTTECANQCVFYCVVLEEVDTDAYGRPLPSRANMWGALQSIVRELQSLGLMIQAPVEGPRSISALSGSEWLTDRELEILSLFASGLKPKDIGTRLYLSSSAVRNHLSTIYRKLGVTNQAQLLQLLLGNPN